MSSETHGVTFEKFSSIHKKEFVDLNLAWLRESFSVEPHDVAVLEDCEVGPDDDDDDDGDDVDDDGITENFNTHTF